MRQILLLFLFTMSINISAQKVYYDRIEKDGSHRVMTTGEDFKIGGKKFSFALSAQVSQNDSVWVLIVSSYEYISSSAEILLKLGDDENVHLKCFLVNRGEIKKPGYGVIIGNIYFEEESKNVDHYSSTYLIKPEEIDRIVNLGINKIRISTGEGLRDKVFRNNNLGKYLAKCKNLILESFNHPHNTDIYDGF